MAKNDKEYNHNAETGEISVRELTNDEQKLLDAINAEKIQAKKAKLVAKTAAQTKLEALGLTIEDLQALGL